MRAWSLLPTSLRRPLRDVRRVIRRSVRSPFAEGAPRRLIVHCAHHRQGSDWVRKVLRAVAEEYGLRFQASTQEALRPATGIFVQPHSLIDVSKLSPHVGSHVIRDPRDVIVSGYFYHLWTEENWARIPRLEFGNRSYQRCLKSLDQEDGISFEIERFVAHDLMHMLEWDYGNPNFVEVKYEELVADEADTFHRIFTHYGFTSAAIATSLSLAKRYSFERQTGRKIGDVLDTSHLRSGRIGQWREVLTSRHLSRCKELLGDALIRLGYETGYDW